MWNFAGRQNDIQGNGEQEHGNWITGFSFFDNARLGDQNLLPDDLKNNKGHNVFYCMPLILGILGLLWQAYRGKRGIRQFWVVFFLFFMTGLAIVIYLNQTPQQPRERDYAYAGSFYAYAIWCGIGIAALFDWIKKLKVKPVLAACVVSVIAILVPLQMASQTWDDHDRSNRYCCRDFGQNYLATLQEGSNPIIFTNGDNDTFPLWYNQDTEGFRTDARVCNLSYLQTDWYIDQMRRPAYDSPSCPITWERLEYCAGTNEYVEVKPEAKAALLEFYKKDPEGAKKSFGENPFELKNILKYWVRSKDENYHMIPTDTVYMTIDKEAVRKSGMMMAADSIPDRMTISLAGKRALYKGDLMILEMLANSNWVRPIYVAITVGSENYLNLGDNLIKEGLANRISPFTTNKPGAKNFDTEKTYDNLMHKYKFGGLETPGLYLDETVMRMCWTHRRMYMELALNLINEDKKDKAAEVLAYADKHIPEYNVPVNFNSGSLDEATAYLALGKKDKAKHILDEIMKLSGQYLSWYLSLGQTQFQGSERDCMMHLYVFHQAVTSAQQIDSQWAEQKSLELARYSQIYEQRGGSLQ